MKDDTITPVSVWTRLSKHGQAMALKGIAADLSSLAVPTFENLQFRLHEFGLELRVS